MPQIQPVLLNTNFYHSNDYCVREQSLLNKQIIGIATLSVTARSRSDGILRKGNVSVVKVRDLVTGNLEFIPRERCGGKGQRQINDAIPAILTPKTLSGTTI